MNYKPIFTEKQKKAFKRKAMMKDFAVSAAAVGVLLIAAIEWRI